MENIIFIVPIIFLIAIITKTAFVLFSETLIGEGKGRPSNVMIATLCDLARGSCGCRPLYERKVNDDHIRFAIYDSEGNIIRSYNFSSSGYTVSDGIVQRQSVPASIGDAIRWRRFFTEYLRTVKC